MLLAVIVFAGACFWLLSPWQFRRNAEQVQQNSTLSRALASDPVPVNTLLPGNAAPTATTQWFEVRMHGHYLPNAEAVARLRSVKGSPSFEIVTAFQPDSGAPMLVDRGYVDADNGAVPGYPKAPTGEVTVIARAQPNEPADPDHRAPFVSAGHQQVYAINSAEVGSLLGEHARPGYFTLIGGQPGGLHTLPVPDLTSGPFLSYALQWIAFGVMALGGLGYFTWRELKPGGVLTAEGRSNRAAQRAEVGTPRGRREVAAMIAQETAAEGEDRTEASAQRRDPADRVSPGR